MTAPVLVLTLAALAVGSTPPLSKAALPPKAVALGPPAGMVRVESGAYRPLYETASGPREVEVAPFYLDALPVTNRQFLAFLRERPQWRRSRVPELFAEAGYLRDWAGDLDLGHLSPDAPVVDVSWFAARAFAAWTGRRLPSTDEWEYAAGASADRADGRTDPEYSRRLLAWYSRPRPALLPDAGLGRPNYWGLHDLHGLVWEWTGDFTSALVSADSRSNRDTDPALFCSAGAVGAADFEDYAAFLRYGYRSGLQARYAVPNLGFRTALDAPLAP